MVLSAVGISGLLTHPVAACVFIPLSRRSCSILKPLHRARGCDARIWRAAAGPVSAGWHPCGRRHQRRAARRSRAHRPALPMPEMIYECSSTRPVDTGGRCRAARRAECAVALRLAVQPCQNPHQLLGSKLRDSGLEWLPEGSAALEKLALGRAAAGPGCRGWAAPSQLPWHSQQRWQAVSVWAADVVPAGAPCAASAVARRAQTPRCPVMHDRAAGGVLDEARRAWC